MTCDELFEKFKCDGDRRTYERLVEAHRPLVASVCRRVLRDPNDVEDVAQETFLKLAAQIDSVSGSVSAWLASTAKASSVDFIRRSVRERNRRRKLGEMGRMGALRVEQVATQEAIRSRLHEAMAVIEPAARELLADRFVRNTPLGVLAVKLKVSVPTASRRVAGAVRQLAGVLREIGVEAASERAVAHHFGDARAVQELDEADHGELRFAPDWRSAELTPFGVTPTTSFLAGWSRPLRVGVLVSYQTALTIGINGLYIGTKWQVHSTAFLPQTGLQLVAVVEPSTVHRGIVESTLRDYGIVGGLVEADDEAALATLDLLLLGNNYAMSAPVARAIRRAVQSGTGLLNEYWTASHVGIDDDPDMRALMLAESSMYKFHMPGICGDPMPATVQREHALLPGLRAGTRIMVRGCGPAYRVVPGAHVVLTKDHLIAPREHGIGGEGPMRMPCYILGELGRGRVAVVHAWPHEWFIRNLSIGGEEYFENLLCWLAGSRNQGI